MFPLRCCGGSKEGSTSRLQFAANVNSKRKRDSKGEGRFCETGRVSKSDAAVHEQQNSGCLWK